MNEATVEHDQMGGNLNAESINTLIWLILNISNTLIKRDYWINEKDVERITHRHLDPTPINASSFLLTQFTDNSTDITLIIFM